MDHQVGPPALATYVVAPRPWLHPHADAECHYVAKAGRTRCEHREIMTPGGYWEILATIQLATIDESRNRRFWELVVLGATNARGVGRERRGNLRDGCMSKLCVE